MDACSVCGAAVAGSDAEWTAEGLRCRRCSLGAEVMGHVHAVAAAKAGRQHRHLRARARLLAWAHGVVWTVSAIVLGEAVPGHPYRAWTAPLIVVALAIVVGFELRQRWAFWAMVAFDVAGVAAPLGAAARSGDGAAWILAAMVAAVPGFFLVALLSLRRRRTIATDA